MKYYRFIWPDGTKNYFKVGDDYSLPQEGKDYGIQAQEVSFLRYLLKIG